MKTGFAAITHLSIFDAKRAQCTNSGPISICCIAVEDYILKLVIVVPNTHPGELETPQEASYHLGATVFVV